MAMTLPAIGMAFGFGAAVSLSIWRPHLALLVWIALLPIQLDTTQALGFRLAPADIFLTGLAVSVLAKRLLARDVRFRFNGTLLVAIALLLWFVATLPLTVANLGYVPAYVLVNKLVGFLLLIVIYWTMLESMHSLQDVTQAVTWYCGLGTLWSFISLVAFYAWRWIGWRNPFVYGEDRLCGLLVDPNAYGGFLVSVLLLLVGRFSLGGGSWTRAGLNTALVFYCVLLTSSRSAWLALVAGLAALLFSARRGERARLAAVGALFLVVTVLHFFLMPTAPATREIAARAPQVEVRAALVTEAVRSSLSSPFRGIGLGVFVTLPGSQGAIVHSTYFWLLAETGIVGLVLLLVMIGTMVWQYWRSVQLGGGLRAQATALAAVSVAWLGFMIGIEAFYQRHFWFLAALLGTLPTLARSWGNVGQVDVGNVRQA